MNGNETGLSISVVAAVMLCFIGAIQCTNNEGRRTHEKQMACIGKAIPLKDCS